MNSKCNTIVYCSMEIALEPEIPTYAGGLGVLAGDTIRSAADMKIPMVAITLLHRRGYLFQRLNASGWQREEPISWNVEDFLTELPERAEVTIEDRKVTLRAWKYDVTGATGSVVPVILLDADVAENSEWDRTLTHYLYGGDTYYRICQEVLLGIGGVRMLRSMGYEEVSRFHMNEGHVGLLALELLNESARREGRVRFNQADLESVRRRCVFTTHTPVAAGQDKFPPELVNRVLRQPEIFELPEVFCFEGLLNMTHLALNVSHFVNGVAKRHAETSQLMFASYKIDAITNGVHAHTWTSPAFRELYDRLIPGWQQDNFSLRFAHDLSRDEIWLAHSKAKERLINVVNSQSDLELKPDVFTIGFARRATPYKRATLLLSDLDRLKNIAANVGGLQIVYGGKAHPNDSEGKALIQRIVQVKEQLHPTIGLVYLQNYDMALAKLLTSGVDLWLNTPEPPMEASGTSGMKAALNGVPSLSILDGWWVEGWIEGETGWAIGEHCDGENGRADRARCDAQSLYDKLERVILPMFHHDRAAFIDVMRHSISLNGSFFNTQRMMQQYVVKAYLE